MKTRFKIIEQIGEGAFNTLYSAYDYILCEKVALKIEKEDKKFALLTKEYEILQDLQNLPNVPKIYNFITDFNFSNNKENNKKSECIEMELLGNNILTFIKNFENYNTILAFDILIKCLNAIEQIHNSGYIHRDIKPTNFCFKKNEEIYIKQNYSKGTITNNFNIYLIDYGLAKRHLNYNGIPISPQINSEQNNFIGTMNYASINSHNNLELSRRDDLFSFFVMILDLLNEIVPWRKENIKASDIKIIKEKCINEPEKYLLLTKTKDKKEILDILNYIKSLKYESKPNYNYIYEKLYILRNKEIQICYFKNELNKQINNLQKNLLSVDSINNNEIEIQTITNPSSIHKITKSYNTIKKSLPSLYSTCNTIKSNCYKSQCMNYINKNDQENFYDNVLKCKEKTKNEINNMGGSFIIGVNNFKKMHSDFINENKFTNFYRINSTKSKVTTEDDKSLIDSLIGYNYKKSNIKIKEKEKEKEREKNRYNIHKKRKNIYFDIVKVKK